MTLWNDIQPWIDKETGLMTAPDGGKDNLALDTAYLIMTMKRINEPIPAELTASINAFLSKTEIATGLFLRNPGNKDSNSVDNLIGCVYLSKHAAEDIRERWNTHLSCFDINNPNTFALNGAFYGRFIGLKAYIDEGADNAPWFFQRWLWCASVFFTEWTQSGAGNPLLCTLECEIMKPKCPRTSEWYQSKNPIGALFSEYFGPTFPLTLHVKDLS